MPSNRAKIDADLVEPTQYNVRPNQTAKKTPQALAFAQNTKKSKASYSSGRALNSGSLIG